MRRFAAVAIVSGILGALAQYGATWIRRQASALGPQGTYSTNLTDRLGAPLAMRDGRLKLAYDPFTVYRNLPGQLLPYVSIDEHGYRVADRTPQGNRPALVFIGGSTAFGQGLASDGETFAAQVASRRPDLHVLNAAVVGFLSGQELAEMVHYADRLRPAQYVVFDGWNELHGQCDGAGWLGLGYNWGMVGEIEEQLRVAAMASAPKRERRTPSSGEIATSYIENLERMEAFARVRGARILFVFQPHLTAAMDPQGRFAAWRRDYYPCRRNFDAEYEDVIARAVKACREHGWRWLDLSAALRSADLFFDPVHPNAAGHAVIAERLAAALN